MDNKVENRERARGSKADSTTNSADLIRVLRTTVKMDHRPAGQPPANGRPN